MNQFYSMEENARLARQAAADGCVLLENRANTLPLAAGDRVAVFGRIAFHYYKSGLGSGGLVNAEYVIGILDALKAEPSITLDQELLHTYEAWIEENPYDNGQGWGQVPWSQKEMPVSEELVQAAAGRNDVAVVVIGRTAGEDQDIRVEEGSYLLTETERRLIQTVTASFPRTLVVLNVGSIIDMSWVAEYQVPAVLYVWQGGQEGGNGVCDVLTGKVCPSGRLTDTIARSIADYPSTPNFGDPVRNVYQEDIYVGYRYFETFAKDTVLYPFGYGLSYTSFEVNSSMTAKEDSVTVTASVTNTGAVAGKNSVLVYVEAPQGKLGKPSRVLAGFAKTGVLAPGQEETLTISVDKYRFASYDDSGVTGHKSCYVLEAGQYSVYAGGDVRSAACVGAFHQEERVLKQLEEAYAPVRPFERMRPVAGENGFAVGYEAAPLRTACPHARRAERMPAEIPFTGDLGYKLRDVVEKKVSLDAFVGQLSDEDLIHLFRGEGMCSPKVTAGTASAFGGVTDKLRGLGIPVGCCSDGPSGIRMDCGTAAFSMPNGILLGCTFDMPLMEALYTQTGLELRKNCIDTLLGPGMNIHRSPLNGRNFEYVSEDPLITGMVAVAQLKGMNRFHVTGTIKHFCGNNQEFKRHDSDGVISERALREIYLKGFEYAVTEGGCHSVMTTYGSINGLWTAGSYDLNTTILRGEWGFRGIVMTDWWAKSNWENGPGAGSTRAPMVAAQNDLYMVTGDAADEGQDDLPQALAEGKITRAELQRGAKNILSFLMDSVIMEYEMGTITDEERAANRSSSKGVEPESIRYYAADGDELIIDASDWNTNRGSAELCGITVKQWGIYRMEATVSSELGELAQLTVFYDLDTNTHGTFGFRGTEGAVVTEAVDLGTIVGANHYLKFYFAADGVKIHRLPRTCVAPLTNPW